MPAFSACRSSRRGPSAPARSRRSAMAASVLPRAFSVSVSRRAMSSSTAKKPRHTRSTLPSTGNAALVERDGSDRRGGVVANAGQRRASRFDAARENAATLLRNYLRAGMEISRPRVVAKPGPALQHVFKWRLGQALHVRPARQEPRVIRRNRLHRGLLQHDFGQPDAVRIGRLAPAAPATAKCAGAGRTRRAALPDRRRRTARNSHGLRFLPCDRALC